MNQKPKIVALVGPSSTGKSELAVQIAKIFNGEIISADSRYVYKELNISTAKPNEAEKQDIPHYLIDICSVEDEYSVGRFVKDADFHIKEITKRDKLPIVVGGTGLYFRALSGIFDIPEVEADKIFRKQAEEIPNEILYKELIERNPEMAKKIHPNNKVKIVRALEITRSGIIPTSKDCSYEILWLGLNSLDRAFLYQKADNRVEKMINNGLINEAEYLFKKYGENNILMNTIGIKELYDFLYNNTAIEVAKENIKKNTRHYIKRQISWFNTEKSIQWLYIDNVEYKKQAIELINNFI